MGAAYILAIVGAVIGAAVASIGVLAANGAPQEAAAAAVGMAWAVIPYCFMRACESFGARDRQKAAASGAKSNAGSAPTGEPELVM